MSYTVYGDGSAQVRVTSYGPSGTSYAKYWAEICCDAYTSGGTLHYVLTLTNPNYCKTRLEFYVNGTLVDSRSYGSNSRGQYAISACTVDANSDVTLEVRIGCAKDWLNASNSTTLVRKKTTYHWTNFNAWSPHGVEDYKSAYFNVNWTVGDWWADITNEPGPVYKPHGTYMELHNIRPYYPYYELNRVTGATEVRAGVYGKTITDESTVNIYMKYRTYTMNYNANGGSNAPTAQTFTYADGFKISSAIPKREGYNFLGWSLSSNAAQATYPPGYAWGRWDSTTYTLYAVWIKVHTITFNGNGGLVNANSSIKMSAVNNTKISNFPTGVKEYYEFLGWNSKSDGRGTYYDSLTVTSDITLYAIYKAESNCYIKVDRTYQRGIAYVRQNSIYCKAVKIS